MLIGLVFGMPKDRSDGIRWQGLLLSSVAMAGAMIGWIIGLKHTSHVGVAAFITASGNLVVPFVGFALFRWPIRSGFWVSFPIALCGLGFLFLDKQSGFEPSHFFFLGSAVLWAISVALAKNATTSTSSSSIAVVQLCVTGFVILMTSLAVEDFPTSLPSAGAFGWFFASVILSTCLRFVLQFEGQRGTAPARAALLMIFEPVWAMIFAFLFFGTPVSPMQAIGCAVIFAVVARDAMTRSAPS
jgi:drug/metabolite transporter (DMT)-like permease